MQTRRNSPKENPSRESLRLEEGEEVTITANGSDESDAIAEMEEHLTKR